MDKIAFENGTLLTPAKVTIDGVDYIVTPAERSGNTPFSAHVMNLLQEKIEKSVVAVSPAEPITNERVWIKKGKNLSKINSFNSVNTSQKIFTSRIEVDANTNYTISFKKARIEGVNITNNTVYGVAHIEIYNNVGELLNDISGQTYNFSTGSKDIQEVVLTPADSAYMIIDFGNNNGDSNFNTSVSNIQVEQGPEATSYEPHVEKEILVKNDNGVFEKFVNVETLENLFDDTSSKGYQKLPSGLILQWGNVSIERNTNSEQDVNINFPKTFSQIYTVVATLNDPGHGATKLTENVGVPYIYNSYFTARFKKIEALAYSSNMVLRYIAIGI